MRLTESAKIRTSAAAEEKKRTAGGPPPCIVGGGPSSPSGSLLPPPAPTPLMKHPKHPPLLLRLSLSIAAGISTAAAAPWPDSTSRCPWWRPEERSLSGGVIMEGMRRAAAAEG